MKEMVKEELKILEAKHPTGFNYLKLQLKEFINLLDEQEEYQQSFKHKQQQQQQSQLSILTQESSSNISRKKRVREEENDDDDEGYTKTKRPSGSGTSAIRKAEACLLKIKTLKSFFCSSNH